MSSSDATAYVWEMSACNCIYNYGFNSKTFVVPKNCNVTMHAILVLTVAHNMPTSSIARWKAEIPKWHWLQAQTTRKFVQPFAL